MVALKSDTLLVHQVKAVSYEEVTQEVRNGCVEIDRADDAEQWDINPNDFDSADWEGGDGSDSITSLDDGMGDL